MLNRISSIKCVSLCVKFGFDCWLNCRNCILWVSVGCCSVPHSVTGWINSSHTSACTPYHTIFIKWFKWMPCVWSCMFCPTAFWRLPSWLCVNIMPSVVCPWRLQRCGSDEWTGQESDSAQRMALSLGTQPKVRSSATENQTDRAGISSAATPSLIRLLKMIK